MTEFQVGKKYSWRNGDVYECVFVGNDKAMIRRKDGTEFSSNKEMNLDWTEYHEPVVTTFSVYIHKFSNSFGASRNGFLDGGVPVIGRLEVTATDGKLTSVNIVEN